MGQPDRVAVLQQDPDLAVALTGGAFDLARRRAVARVLEVARGPWPAAGHDLDLEGTYGLLVLDGVLVRRVIADGTKPCAELLGVGDVLQPWRQVASDSSVSVEVEWEAIDPVRLAILDRDFAAAIAPWPEVGAALAGRVMNRAHWLAFHLAVCQIRRIDQRLLLVLWRLADRWGRVTPRGVELTITLPHALLASLVVARRPAVSLALQGLVATGAVQRRGRSQWTLHGAPPALAPMPQWPPLAPSVDAGRSLVAEHEALDGLGEALVVV